MPDKKLTDAEIAKDLECYRGQKLFAFNGKRPEIYIHDIIDLINRQKAEIERLERIVKHTAEGSLKIIEMANETKAEAYKEFAEKANEIIDLIVELMFDGNVSKCQLPSCHKPSKIPCESEICIQENKEYWHGKLDNLLKELVGETDGSK